MVELAVDDKGFVTAANVVTEEPQGFGFGDAALTAGRRWTFEPGRPGQYRITVKFAPPDGRDPVDIANLPETQPISRVPANYPGSAEDLGINGTARVAVAVAPDGSVDQTWVVLEAPTGYAFGKAADHAVKQWKFAAGAPRVYVVQVHFRTHGSQDSVAWSDLQPAPQVVHRVEAKYPDAAKSDGDDGSVRLAVAILDDGSVADATVVTENPKAVGFGDAARNAVLLWRFTPGRQGVYRLRVVVEAP